MALPKDLRAVVTGGGSGLGRAFCLEVARRGGRVVVSDVDMEGAEETVRQVRGAGSPAFAVECDVRDPEAVEALADRADELLGATDLVCNNAGVAVAGPFCDVPLEDWRWIMDINLWGVIHGCRTFIPRMQAQGHGYVINVASAAGLLSAPTMAPYNVTKAGVVALSETLYAEFKKSGIRVTVLCPTFFTTQIAANSRSANDAQAEGAKVLIEKLMRKSKVQAPDVAKLAFDDVGKGRLYTLPMRDGRMMWRLKRATPRRFYELLSKRPDGLTMP